MNSPKQDKSIDFIKGIATISVIFLHSMPNYYIGSCVWIGQAVPLFLLVTSYLTFQSFQNGKTVESYYSSKSFFKMLNRIFRPFIIVILIQVFLLYLIHRKPDFILTIETGGIGPGCYYPWIFLQIWIILPVIIYITNRISIPKSFVLFLLISIVLEATSSLLKIDPLIYRLTFYRYLFLIYLGCLLKKLELKITPSLVILALFSLILILSLTYSDLNLEPFIFNSGWKTYNYLTYFYSVLVFLLLVKLFHKLKNSYFSNFLLTIGKYSYEIFLSQMFIFTFISIQRFSFVNSIYLQNILFILFTVTFSIAPVLIYKLYFNKKTVLEKILRQKDHLS